MPGEGPINLYTHNHGDLRATRLSKENQPCSGWEWLLVTIDIESPFFIGVCVCVCVCVFEEVGWGGRHL